MDLTSPPRTPRPPSATQHASAVARRKPFAAADIPPSPQAHTHRHDQHFSAAAPVPVALIDAADPTGVSILLRQYRESLPPPMSPEAQRAARARAAQSIIRAATAIQKVDQFDRLPAHTVQATRQIVDDDTLICALETIHAQEQAQHLHHHKKSAAAAGTNHTADYLAAMTQMQQYQSGTASPSSTLRGVGGASSPLLGNTYSSTILGAAGSALAAYPRQHHQPHEAVAAAAAASAARIRRMSPRRKAATAHSPTRAGWSPRRGAQLEPTNIALQQVLNEVKVRIPAFRRGAATAAGTELECLVENYKRLFLLMDARGSGMLSLGDIASFGRRIGGQTQKLLSVGEMRARLHYRFPDRFLCPSIFYNNVDGDGQPLQQQQAQPAAKYSAAAEATAAAINNSSAISATSGGVTPVGSFVVRDSVLAPPAAAVMIAAAPPVPLAAPLRSVRVLQPNTYEQPIPEKLFVAAVIAASERKWSVAAPQVMARSPAGRTRSPTANAGSQPSGAGAGSSLSHAPSLSGASFARTGSSMHGGATTARKADRSPTKQLQRPSSARLARSGSTVFASSPANAATSKAFLVRRASQASSVTSMLQDLAGHGARGSGGMHAPSRTTEDDITSVKLRRSDSSASAMSSASSSALTEATTTSGPDAADGAGGGKGGGGKGKLPAEIKRLLDPRDTGFITLDALMRACPRVSSVDAIVPEAFSLRALFEKWSDDKPRMSHADFAEMMAKTGLLRASTDIIYDPLRPNLSDPGLAGASLGHKGRSVDWKRIQKDAERHH